MIKSCIADGAKSTRLIRKCRLGNTDGRCVLTCVCVHSCTRVSLCACVCVCIKIFDHSLFLYYYIMSSSPSYNTINTYI